MKWFVAFKVLVAFYCVHLTASAPLRLLRIRNMTFLFVLSPDGEGVEVLYAPEEKLGSFPVGEVPLEMPFGGSPVLGDEQYGPDDDIAPGPDDHPEPVNDEPYDPELDAPRVEPSVIQAPKFKTPCERGHRVDRHGICRRIW